MESINYLPDLKHVLQISKAITSSTCFRTREVHFVNQDANSIFSLSHSCLFDLELAWD